MEENYKKYVETLARALFEKVGPVNATETMKEYEKAYPDMWYQVELLVSQYEKRAQELRESNAPEYLEGLKEYKQIMDEIRSTLKPIPEEVFGKATYSFRTTKEQDKRLNELMYVGVVPNEYDMRVDLGAPVREGGRSR